MGRPLKPFEEWDSEVRDAVLDAIRLVEGKHGFKTHFEIWRDCELTITVGHNIYTTSIHLGPPMDVYSKRRANYHNRYAYYCNGIFWGNWTRTEVELI